MRAGYSQGEAEDLRGRVYGGYKVLCDRPFRRKGNKDNFWNCVCLSCGDFYEVNQQNLKRNLQGCSKCNSIKGRIFDDSGMRSYYLVYRNSAKYRNFKFEIDYEVFCSIVVQDCFYCTSSPSLYVLNKKKNYSIMANGIDRVDSSLGYSMDNIVPCCRICNRAKLDMSVSEYVAWLKKVSNLTFKEPS